MSATSIFMIDTTDGLLYDVQDLLALAGTDGTDGTNGVGVPAGGTTGQVLSKINGTDFNTQWSTLLLASITDITVASELVTIPKGIRPGLYDELDAPPSGAMIESVNDGHLYWIHRDGSVHLLCESGSYSSYSGSDPSPYSPGFLRDGSYFSTYGSAVPSSLVINSARQYFVPFYCPHLRTSSALAIYINSAIAASNVRLGIYANDEGKPGSLLIDGGTSATTSTGNKPVSVFRSLSPGWYWLSAIFSHDVTVVGEPYQASSRLRLVSMNGSAAHYVYTLQSYGALPSAPVGTLYWESEAASDPICPRIGITFAS